ncbi:MAG: hypothetical protein ACRDQD_26790 [Nocardioidaceae bacterium]
MAPRLRLSEFEKPDLDAAERFARRAQDRHKLPLRSDATRTELRAALDPIAGVRGVEANVEGSSVVTVVKISPSADQVAIKAILGR